MHSKARIAVLTILGASCTVLSLGARASTTIAAKSLVRSKEFEKRDFAEYFLIGTLTSTALAIVAGGLVRLVFVFFW